MSQTRRTDEEFEIGIFHLGMPPVDAWVDNLRDYESAGWDACWLSDQLRGEAPLSIWDSDLVEMARYVESPHAIFDTVSLLGYGAAVTEDIHLGVGVTESLRRHPVVLAQAMQTLHHLSKGRIQFGLGAGVRLSTEPYGIPYHRPVSRMEEALQIIRRAWETDQNATFDFDGEFWRLEDAIFALPPVEVDGAPPHPPIFLAANGPRTCSLTGRYADGWYPSGLPPAQYVEGWERVADAAEDAGRDPANITRGLEATVVIAETHEEAEELLDSLMVRYYALFNPPWVFEACGYDHPLESAQTSYRPTELVRSDALELAHKVPMEVVKAGNLWGTPTDVIATIDEYRDVGVEHPTLGNLTPFADAERTGVSFGLLEEVRETVQQ